MRVRIATCLELPEPDADEALLLDALARAGLAPELAAWDDPALDWDAPVPTVLRSTWNYLHRRDAFLAWCDRVARAAPLFNPPDVARWNTHKRYLADLAARGIPVVPTVHLARGERASLTDVARGAGWRRVVVKPAVSAGSFGTACFGEDTLDAGEAFLARMLAERDMMVQQYLPAVEGPGERALVWIDGEITHAVRKSPRFTGGREAVTGPWPVADDERAVALEALAPYAARLLYARVDLVRDAHGRPAVMELELVEPSLFFRQCPEALARLVAAIQTRLTR
jgi:hypothetical protein